MLVNIFGIDIVSTVQYKTIVTSRRNVYERFYNYYDKGYKIQQLPIVTLNPRKNEFILLETFWESIDRLSSSEAKYKEKLASASKTKAKQFKKEL